MKGFAEALSALTALLVSGSLDALRGAARQLLGTIPTDQADLYALTEGVVAVLEMYDDSVDRDMLVAQLEGDLSTVAKIAANRPVEGKNRPVWVDDAMLGDFVDNQRHLLAEVEEILLDAANAGDAERRKIARQLHTLKGESATIGFHAGEQVYHALEDRFEGAKSLVDVVDDALAAKDWLLRAGASVLSGGGPPPGHEALVEQLRSGMAAPAPKAAAKKGTPRNVMPRDPESAALFDEFYDESSESLTQADELLVTVEQGRADPQVVDALFRTFHTIKGLAGFLELGAIQALAHGVETLLDLERTTPGTLDHRATDVLLRATTMMRAALAAIRDAKVKGATEPPDVRGFDALLQEVIDARTPGAARPPAAAAERPAPVAAPDDDAAPGSQTAAKETIKVDLSRVDNLVETIGELVIVESMAVNSPELQGQVGQRTRHHLAQLSKIVRDLQRQGLSLRMVPLRGVFQKMNRLVRDLSRRSGKAVNLMLAGQDAEMDRSLAERLGDPLVHMMRNAVDHGVEPVENRRAQGKPDVATIRLSAYHEGGNIIIELADDGKGLDKAKILQKAMDKGIVGPDAALSEREIFELIFAPGFSTAAQVTELSGRGVGMDVVKKTVEDLRGRVQISSVEGRGTTFRMVLPLTLAIIDGMLLDIGGRRFVLPTLAITESLKPQRAQLHQFAGRGRLVEVRGDHLPLVDLGQMLGVPSAASEEPSRGFVVVIDGMNGRFGLIVDDLIGQQQVVIKNIDASINREGLFSGGAILSDGQVGMILNPAALRAE